MLKKQCLKSNALLLENCNEIIKMLPQTLVGLAELADFFLRPKTLTAGSFAALWPTDFKFLALKDLNFLKKHIKNQETSSILKVVFALSKWPYFHRAYVVTVCNQNFIAVYQT